MEDQAILDYVEACQSAMDLEQLLVLLESKKMSLLLQVQDLERIYSRTKRTIEAKTAILHFKAPKPADSVKYRKLSL